MPAKTLSLPVFRDFVPEIIDGLQEASKKSPFDDFEISRAYAYWIADLFETIDPQSFVFTDGGNELGIDFYVVDGNQYYIYQCKAVSLDTLDAAELAPTFDADDVNQLLEGLDFVLDPASNYSTPKPEIRELRTNYHRSLSDYPSETQLVATLALLGSLTRGGRDRFRAMRTYYQEKGVTLRLIEWPDVFEAVHRLDPVPAKDVRIDLSVDSMSKDVLYQSNWIYALVYAKDLVDAFEKYGVALFDLNVRNELRNSRVNRAIVESLTRSQGRKRFHHLNNGLLVVCNNYRLPREDGESIRVFEPQIINGCQTVMSLWRAYKDLPPAGQKDFRTDVRVQVKVIQQAPQDLLDEVVITTNNQNPMRARNLRSNSVEQRNIQRSFRDLPDKWFYIRKDGEFEAQLSRGRQVSRFRKQDYEIDGSGRKARYRKVDNEDIAKSWFSWIGNSGRVVQGGIDYFENDETYRRVFTSRPTDEYWTAFKEADFRKPGDELFESISPTAHQYLLAYSIAAYITEQTPSSYKNRKDSIGRLVKDGKIPGDRETGSPRAPQSEIAKALADDREFIIAGYLSNIENILVELYAFVLCQRYGSLSPSVSRALLTDGDIAVWARSGFSPAQESGVRGATLWRVYEFLRWAVKNYFNSNRYEIEASPRPKMFFARRESIVSMRKVVMDSNELSKEIVHPWKMQEGTEFIASLPDIGVGF